MTREEQILKAARDYNSGITLSSPSNVIHFENGAKWADEHPYWRPATEHPVTDVEVIALVGKYLKVVFAHIVKDREKVVDYDGWNIPEVKWWMPIQSIGELEEK